MCWLHTWPRRYGFAVIAVAVATLLRYPLSKLLGDNLPFLLFFPAIWLVAWMAGLGPGVVSVILSGAAASYLFSSPVNRSALGLPINANGLLLFSIVGVALSGVVDVYRRRAERLREFERAAGGVEEGIIVLDRQYRYVVANRVFLGYQGVKKEELIGRSLAETMDASVFETTVKPKLDECFRGNVVRLEERYNYPAIGERNFSVAYLPIEGPTRVERVVCILQDITEQKAARTLLERQELLFRTLVESAPMAMVVSLGQGQRTEFYNPKFTELFGYSQDEVPDLDHWWPLAYPDMEYRRRISELWKKEVREAIARNGATPSIEARVRCKDGSERDMEFKLVCVGEKNLVFGTDVTEIKRSERSLKLFRTLIDQSNDAVEVVDPETLRFLDVNETACRDLGYTREELLAMTVLDIDPRVNDSVRSHVQEKLQELGFMVRETVHRRKDGSTFPVELSMRLVQLDRSYVVTMCRDISDRKRAEEALRSSEDQYRDLVDHSEDLVCTHDLEGRLVSVNPAPARLLGYDVDEFLKIPMRDLIVPEYRELFDEYLRRIKENGADKGLLCVRARSGEVRTWEYNNTLRTEGIDKPIVRGMAHDVTEKRRAELGLQASEKRYRLLFEKNLAGVATASLDGEVLDCNDAWARILGYDRAEEVRGKQASEFYYRMSDREPTLEALRGEGAFLSREMRLRRKDGDLVWVLFSAAPVDDGAGRLVVQATAIDISERKRVEEALQKSESHFRFLVEQASDGIFITDVQGKYVDVNSAGAQMLGYTREELLQLSVSDTVMAEEVPRIGPEVGRFEGGAAVLSEWKLRRKDGSSFPGEVCGKQLPDGRLQGILRDISERRDAEKAMRRSEERFRVALKDSPITVFNQDCELRYTWIYNPQLYWQHEAIGRTDAEIIGSKKAASLVALKRKVLNEGVGVREDVVVPNGGKNYAFDIWIEPVFSEDGSIIGITGAAMDIARQREMTDRLQDARDKLAQEKSYLENEIQTELGFEEIIGQSPALREVLKTVRVVAPTDSTVLLLGETGTGKELVARSVHALSSRHNKTFIKLNCAAVPSGLLESELFGHERGAFTGAVSQKVGRIELADKGTLFLDEIGELPVELQPKLLRVLQDREFERLGGVNTFHVDVRIISATNRDLHQDVADKNFREDLFYRLNVFPIELPPLRERRGDVPMLVHHFMRKHSARMGKHIEEVPVETMRVLQNWNWPGNIRELENMIERMVILSKGQVLAAPPVELDAPQEIGDDNLTEMEREHIMRVLEETHGVLAGTDGAAARLGMKRTTLQSMIKRFGIQLHDFRRGSGTFGPS